MRFCSVLIICLIASSIVFAQDAPVPAHTISCFGGSEVLIGHGFLPSEQLFANTNENNSRLNHTVSKYTGAIFATYCYHVSHVISLGITAAYENEQGTFIDNSYNYNYYYYYMSGGFLANYFNHSGTFKRSCFTIAPEVTFSYGDFSHDLVRLYSIVGIGYTFRNETVRDAVTNEEFRAPYIKTVHANAYVSPLGIRVGRRLSGFFELGIGYKGILNYGATYRF